MYPVPVLRSASPLYAPVPAPRAYKSGMTLIELLTVIAIVMILATILIPVSVNMRQKALGVDCVSRLRSIGSAIALYASDNSGYVPRNIYGARWQPEIAPYLGAHPDINFSNGSQVNPYYDTLRCPALDIKIGATGSPSNDGVYGYHDAFYAGQSAIKGGDTGPERRVLAELSGTTAPMMACHSEDSGARMDRNALRGPSPKALEQGYSGSTHQHGISPNHGRFASILFFDGRVEMRDVCDRNLWPWNDPTAFSLNTIP